MDPTRSNTNQSEQEEQPPPSSSISVESYIHHTENTSANLTPDQPPSHSSSFRNSLPPYSEESSFLDPGSSSSSSAVKPAAPSPPGDDFFDIAPRSDATAFQVGYLGLRGFQAWIKGDVLVKLDSESRSKGGYSKCTVELVAIETVQRSSSSSLLSPTARGAIVPEREEVELFYSIQTLWDAQAATTSASPPSTLPSTMPFSFPLTPDLPHCIHSRNSSLTYAIHARLHSTNPSLLPDAVKMVPVHLTRYTRPGRLDSTTIAEIDGAELPLSGFSLSPHTWTVHAPTTAYVQLNKTIFRRAEPIDVKVRIPPPAEASVNEKGLKLRSVEADLVRIIRVKPETPRSPSDQIGESSSTKVQAEHLGTSQAQEPMVHEALLAHSGKLCRFHSQRPVLLRLTLHPPFDPANMPHPHPDHDALASGPVFGRGGGGGCESISQETVMHTISFEVRIKVGLIGGRGERRDIVCTRAIRVLPGAAGLEETSDAASSAQNHPSGEKSQEKLAEKSRSLDTPGMSTDALMTSALLEFGMDDEYDGYEDVGRGIDDIINEANGIDNPGSSSSHEERLEQLRQLLEGTGDAADHGPPPSLLESQHDLQVEVEVEGVGLAMPRNRLPADPCPDNLGHSRHLHAGGSDEGQDSGSLLPPPPIDADHTYSARTPDEPPPPISPLHDEPIGSGHFVPVPTNELSEGHSSSRYAPPPHDASEPNYIHLDPGPAYQENEPASAAREPPPYADAHSQRRGYPPDSDHIHSAIVRDGAVTRSHNESSGSSDGGEQLTRPPAYGAHSSRHQPEAVGGPPGYED